MPSANRLFLISLRFRRFDAFDLIPFTANLDHRCSFKFLFHMPSFHTDSNLSIRITYSNTFTAAILLHLQAYAIDVHRVDVRVHLARMLTEFMSSSLHDISVSTEHLHVVEQHVILNF